MKFSNKFSLLLLFCFIVNASEDNAEQNETAPYIPFRPTNRENSKRNVQLFDNLDTFDMHYETKFKAAERTGRFMYRTYETYKQKNIRRPQQMKLEAKVPEIILQIQREKEKRHENQNLDSSTNLT